VYNKKKKKQRNQPMERISSPVQPSPVRHRDTHDRGYPSLPYLPCPPRDSLVPPCPGSKPGRNLVTKAFSSFPFLGGIFFSRGMEEWVDERGRCGAMK
jgi:hypothetical protein